MYYKLRHEEGNYIKRGSGEVVNILCAEEVYLPVGEEEWDEFKTYEEMLETYNIRERKVIDKLVLKVNKTKNQMSCYMSK